MGLRGYETALAFPRFNLPAARASHNTVAEEIP